MAASLDAEERQYGCRISHLFITVFLSSGAGKRGGTRFAAVWPTLHSGSRSCITAGAVLLNTQLELMRYRIAILILLIPQLANAGWDDFRLFWLDDRGKEFLGAPNGVIGDLKTSKVAGELLEVEMNLVGREKASQRSSHLGSCIFSFEQSTMDCSKAKRILADAKYKADWIESPDLTLARDIVDLKRRFTDKNYTRLAYAYRCTSGCTHAPKLILFYWHTPPL